MMTLGTDKKAGINGRLPPLSATIWTSAFIILCLVNFVLFVSTQMLFPSVPVFLLTIGGDTRDVGVVMAVYTISAMISRPPAGWLVDRYSRSKVMVGGLLLMLLASLLYQWADNVAIMTGIRILHGLAFGMASTAIGTIVVDCLPLDRLNEGMGYFGLTSTLSMAIAPMIGFWLVGHFGYPTFFAAISIMSGLAFLIAWMVRAGNAPLRPPGSAPPGIWSSLAEKSALPAAGVMFFLALVYGALLSYISLYAIECGIDNVGLFFTATAIAMLISRPVAGRIADEGRANLVLAIGHLAIFFGMLTTGLSQTIGGFILAGLINGIGYGSCMPVLQAQAVRYAPVHRRGAATGTFFALFDLGIGLGTVIWGYVAAASNYQTMYYWTLVPVALAGLVYFLFTARRGI